MVDQRLFNYIEEHLKKGAPEEQIKAKLLDAGWKKEEIDKGFNTVPKNLTTALSQTNSEVTDFIKTYQKKGYTKEQIKSALKKAGWKISDVDKAFKNLNKTDLAQEKSIKQIEDYIKKYEAQGYTKDQIVEALKKSGKTQTEIDTAYKRLKAKGHQGKIDKKWIIIGLVTLLFLLLLAGLFLFLPSDTGCTDNDNDGYLGGLMCAADEWDCDDTDPAVHPGVAEVCGDKKDNDCDNRVDEGCKEITPPEPFEPITPGQVGDVCTTDLDCAAGLTCINGICSEYGTDGGIAEGLLKPECNDSEDNDGDGNIDMDDAGCEDEEDDNEEATCQNGIDDDEDGLIDFTGGCDDDSDGDLDYFCGCDINSNGTIEFPDESMSVQDCIDAGYNSSIYFCENEPDFCNDTGFTFVLPDDDCTELDSNGEAASSPSVYECSDGIDNDNDGLIDYPDDPGCSSEDDTDETDITTPEIILPYACNDGLDNDQDGLIDYPNDPGCSSSTDTDETNALPDLTITNVEFLGLDNPTTTEFNISINNNGNANVSGTFILKGEFSYNGAIQPYTCKITITEIAVFEEQTHTCEVELGPIMDQLELILMPDCEDELDIDFTATVDSTDAILESDEANNVAELSGSWGLEEFMDMGGANICPEIITGQEPAEYPEPQAAVEAPECSDEYDNDGDELIDLNDPGCESSIDDDERNQCSDEYDNDGDGLVDMLDPGCQVADVANAKEKDDNVAEAAAAEVAKPFADVLIDKLDQFFLGRKPINPEVNEEIEKASAIMGLDLMNEYNIPEKGPVEFGAGLRDMFKEDVTQDIVIDKLNNNEYDWNNGRDVLQFYEDAAEIDFDLRNADLQDANLNKALLVGLNLRGANLRDTDMQNAVVVNSNLERTNLQRTDISETVFANVDMTEANLRDVRAERTVFVDTNVKNADMTNLRTSDLRVRDTNLNEATTTMNRNQITVVRQEINPQDATQASQASIEDTNAQVSEDLSIERIDGESRDELVDSMIKIGY